MFVHVVSSLLLYVDFSLFVSNEMSSANIFFLSLSFCLSVRLFPLSFHMNLPCEQMKTNRETSLPSFVFLSSSSSFEMTQTIHFGMKSKISLLINSLSSRRSCWINPLSLLEKTTTTTDQAILSVDEMTILSPSFRFFREVEIRDNNCPSHRDQQFAFRHLNKIEVLFKLSTNDQRRKMRERERGRTQVSFPNDDRWLGFWSMFIERWRKAH